MSGQIGSPILTSWWVCFHGFPYSFLWKPLRNTKCLCPVLTGLICQNKNLVTVLTKNLNRSASKPSRVNPYLKNSPPLVTRVLMTWLWFTANVSTAGLLIDKLLAPDKAPEWLSVLRWLEHEWVLFESYQKTNHWMSKVVQYLQCVWVW